MNDCCNQAGKGHDPLMLMFYLHTEAHTRAEACICNGNWGGRTNPESVSIFRQSCCLDGCLDLLTLMGGKICKNRLCATATENHSYSFNSGVLSDHIMNTQPQRPDHLRTH